MRKSRQTATERSDTDRRRELRRRLLRWYDRHHRRLPWRVSPGEGDDTGHGRASAAPRRADPYHVLVSETMLQQTQVATVVPYFERFIARFPTVEALAAADEQAVLRQWQGLGYYRRARHLHAAAKAIVDRFGGQVPRTVDELRSLPGVGRYTAGAVASIAFDEPAAILDGNVARVLARLFAIDTPVREGVTQSRLWDLAGELVPQRRAGDFNQAMMELGATACTPRAPGCLLCPVAALCEANRQGRADALPVMGERRAPTAVTHRVAVIARRGRYLFEPRPDTGLWAGMWQFPTAEDLPPHTALPDWVRDRYGLTVTPTAEPDVFTHQTTHRTIRFEVHRFRATAGRLRPDLATQWRSLHTLDDLPLPNPQRRIVTMLHDAP